MIDAKELRIGNYIQLRDKHVMVGGIPNMYKLLIPGEQYAVEVEEFDPIPLTEELLLKCGITEAYSDSKGYIYSINEVKFLRCFFDIPSFFIETKGDDDLFNRPIESLHQLQNLYFDLTGKDLDVEL